MGAVTAIILTLNEEGNIAECIRTASWADEVLVLDSGSTDRTVEIARSLGAEVRFREFTNYAEQRNAALGMARTPWVFFLDADERVPPELASEVREAVEREDYAGWWVPRRNYIAGRWIRHGGWYPDYQLRLMQRERARYDPAWEVHEIVVLDGPAGYLKHPLIHYNYRNWREFVSRQFSYARLEVRALMRRGIRPRPWSPFSMPVREFLRRYVSLRGYKDGFHGFVLAALMGIYTMYVYGVLWRRYNLQGRSSTV